MLSAAGFLGLVFGLIEGQVYGWWRAERSFLGLAPGGISVVPFAFAAGLVCLAGFVFVERARARAGRPVLVDFTLFRIPSFLYGNIAVLIVGLGELGLVFVIPLYLQVVLGLSAFDTGLVLTALAAGAFVAGGLAAPLTRRIGARRVVQLGLAVEIVGVVAIGLTFAADRAAWEFVPQLFVYGLGVGFATAQLTSVILADVPPAQSGEGSGIQSTSRQIGSALGIAILGTALAAGLAAGTRDRLADVTAISPPQRVLIVDAVERSGGAALGGLRRAPGLQAAVEPVEEAFVDSARRAALIAAAFLLLGLLASLRLPPAVQEQPELDSPGLGERVGQEI